MRRVLANAAEYADNYRLELCRNCVRSPRKHPQNRRLRVHITGRDHVAVRSGRASCRTRCARLAAAASPIV